ncbi:MAG: phosphoglycerate dehydrogenase [Acidobacteria bacterium]|nr:phosphoglycerate dehydrogenase [Acidobacteriota bacterium]
MRILITEQISDAGVDLLKSEKGWEVDVNIGILDGELLNCIPGYHALIVRSKTRITREVIERGENLRVIGRAGAGVDNIDLEAATRQGIVVMNTPGGNNVAAAEHTMALLLSAARLVPQADASIKSGRWDKKDLVGVELRGKNLGIMGLGKIGREVARRALAFEMRVLAYDPYVSARVAEDLSVELVSLDELLRQADFITLHMPLNAETRGMVDGRFIAAMKDGVRVINCARGELVDEQALFEALRAGKIAAAGLDVFQQEPPQNPGLAQLPTVISTPHIAGSTHEALEKVGYDIAAQVRDYLKEGVIRNAVNFPAIPLEEYRRLQPFLQLGEKLGSFVSQISRGRMVQIGVRYYGELTRLNVTPLTNAVVKGILSPILSERVNLINARANAEERGINLLETKSSRLRSFSNLISVKLLTDQGEEWIEGTVLHQTRHHIVSLDGIDIEAPLLGGILFVRNADMPGVIGQVGTLLGNRQINIANFALGRHTESKEAVGIVNVDSPVPDGVLEELRAIPAIRFARVVRV